MVVLAGPDLVIGYAQTAGKCGPNTIFCFCHDSVKGTNHEESDLFDSDLGHFHIKTVVKGNGRTVMCQTS